jgi:hypothetical protein
MYMFVLVTMIVALIGIYTHVFNVQTAHMNGQESGIAKAMLDWHATAAGLGQDAVEASVVTAGCSLTDNFTTLGYCHNSFAGGVHLPGSVPAGAIGLPQGYTNVANPLVFYSLAYQVTTGGVEQNFVLTFVPPPPAAAGGLPSFICLPGMLPPAVTCGASQPIDIVMNDLLIQIKRRGVSPLSYGTVNAAGTALVTSPVPNSSGVMAPLLYLLPVGVVPKNSIGLISQINLCTNC